jgi:hypothetical protein
LNNLLLCWRRTIKYNSVQNQARQAGDKPALARLTPFIGQDLSLLLRKRSNGIDRVARSGPGTDKNAGVCMKTPANIHDHNLRI